MFLINALIKVFYWRCWAFGEEWVVWVVLLLFLLSKGQSGFSPAGFFLFLLCRDSVVRRRRGTPSSAAADSHHKLANYWKQNTVNSSHSDHKSSTKLDSHQVSTLLKFFCFLIIIFWHTLRTKMYTHIKQRQKMQTLHTHTKIYKSSKKVLRFTLLKFN